MLSALTYHDGFSSFSSISFKILLIAKSSKSNPIPITILSSRFPFLSNLKSESFTLYSPKNAKTADNIELLPELFSPISPKELEILLIPIFLIDR